MNLPSYPRIWLAVVVALVACAGWYVQGQQSPQQPPAASARITRTGETAILPSSDAQVLRIRWEPGSRTYWHSHGQESMILVEEGLGRTQERGGQITELKPRQPLYTAPNIEHWHGASPKVGATTVAVYPRGVALNLLSEVTDAEYLGKR